MYTVHTGTLVEHVSGFHSSEYCHCDSLPETITRAYRRICSAACPTAPVSSLILRIPSVYNPLLPHSPLSSPDSLASDFWSYATHVPLIPHSLFFFVLLRGWFKTQCSDCHTPEHTGVYQYPDLSFLCLLVSPKLKHRQRNTIHHITLYKHRHTVFFF